MDIETEILIRKSVREFIDNLTYDFTIGKSRSDLIAWYYIVTIEMIVWKFVYGSLAVDDVVNDEWREYE